jgi:hypothetical protein
MIGGCAGDVELARQVVDVLLDGVVGDDELFGDAAVDRPSAISRRTSRSRGVRRSSSSAPRRPIIRETTSGSSADPRFATRFSASMKV